MKIDTSGFAHKTADDLKQPFKIVAPGKAHLVVTEAEVSPDGRYVEYDVEVIAHEDKASIGESFSFRIYVDGKEGARRRAVCFALATGLLSPADWAAMQSQSNPDIPIERAYGRTFCTEVQHREFDTRSGGKGVAPDIGFVFLNPELPESDGYPKSSSMCSAQTSGSTSEEEIPF